METAIMKAMMVVLTLWCFLNWVSIKEIEERERLREAEKED